MLSLRLHPRWRRSVFDDETLTTYLGSTPSEPFFIG
jgi:hypothetical protein